MKTFQIIKIPKSIAGDLAGTYTIHELNAVEYIQATDKAVQYCRATYGDKWDGKLPQSIVTATVVSISVTNEQNKNPPIDMPAKLYEVLAAIALPINTLSTQEYESLFFDSTTGKKPKQT